jgi:hypothetical protein
MSGFFGDRVASAGDINGDGYSDIIVGARTGQAYVYLGGTLGISSTQQPTAVPASNGSVAGAGDVNGDGYADIITTVTVYLGGPLGVYSSLPINLSNQDAFARGGAGIGDINGDGYADLVTTDDGYMNCVGRAYVYLGSASGGLLGQLPVVLTGPEIDGEFGVSVAILLRQRLTHSIRAHTRG